jgi:hypothetical protein
LKHTGNSAVFRCVQFGHCFGEPPVSTRRESALGRKGGRACRQRQVDGIGVPQRRWAKLVCSEGMVSFPVIRLRRYNSRRWFDGCALAQIVSQGRRPK